MELTIVTVDDIKLIKLEGFLDFESASSLQSVCQKLAQSPRTKVIFDLSRLKFVGSSGITLMMSSLRKLNLKAKDLKPRFIGVSSEFAKVFKAYQSHRNLFFIYPSLEEAIKSFEELGRIKRGKRKGITHA